MTNRLNIVLINCLARIPSQVSRIPEAVNDSVNLFIVDENLDRIYSEQIITNNKGISEDVRKLNAQSGKANINTYGIDIAEFLLPADYQKFDTIYVYYETINSVRVKSSFDLMCITQDFPTASQAERRYLIVQGETLGPDVSSIISVDDFQKPYDFFAPDSVKEHPDFDPDVPRTLTLALIEYLNSNFDKKESGAHEIAVNVYNRVHTRTGEILSGPRPHWPMNVEISAIKGLIWSVGLDQKDHKLEFESSFYDGITTQNCMIKSSQYRKEVVDAAIAVLGSFAFRNDILDEVEVRSLGGWYSIDTWNVLLGKL